MNLIKYIILPALLAGTLVSCKKDQYYVFDDVARIQFGPAPDRIYNASFDLADTLKPYTFYYEAPTKTQDTIFFDIYAIGGISNKDRAFSLSQLQVPGELSAESGVHYKPFTDLSLKEFYSIKAGKVHASVPVVLLRDATLKTGTYKLNIQVIENENFQLGEAKKLWRKVEFTDRLSQPAAWNASVTQYYFGKYSVAKHAFMIEQSGEKWDQVFLTGVLADYSLLSFWRLQMRTYLVNYNNANTGNPLKDENNEVIVFP